MLNKIGIKVNKMNKLTKIVGIVLLLVAVFSSCALTAQKKHGTAENINSVNHKKPNVLFILADDLGINALNCYGNDIIESPNIDKLYSEGIHFTNGYSNDPTCAPSRASIMSGQYVSRHHVYRVADRYKKQKGTLEHMKYLPPDNYTLRGSGSGLAPDKITMGEAFKENGYVTCAYGKWHLGKNALGIPNQGFDEGFEIKGHYNFHTSPEQPDIDNTQYSADVITKKTKEFIAKSVKEGKPFFAYVPYYLVHKPLETKPEYLKHFRKKYKGKDKLDDDEIKVLAMIKSLDDGVGELTDYVKSLGIEDNTIIVFTSDNGHYKTKNRIFTLPYRGFKGQTYEGGIRVPYIFKWKNHIPEGTVSTEPIIHVDIYPTVLGLTGSKKPENYTLDGEDITNILLHPTAKSKRDALVWEYTNYARYNKRKKTFASEWVNVIQMDGFKLTEVVENDSYYMFNLNDDPYETKDVINDYPKEASKLKARLEKWKKETGYEPPKKNPKYIGK